MEFVLSHCDSKSAGEIADWAEDNGVSYEYSRNLAGRVEFWFYREHDGNCHFYPADDAAIHAVLAEKGIGILSERKLYCFGCDQGA